MNQSGSRVSGAPPNHCMQTRRGATVLTTRRRPIELVLNLKTAKTLGLTIAPSLLLRADRIID